MSCTFIHCPDKEAGIAHRHYFALGEVKTEYPKEPVATAPAPLGDYETRLLGINAPHDGPFTVDRHGLALPRSFKCEVRGRGETGFVSNGLRFATEGEVEAYGDELLSRWTGAAEFRVADSQDEVTHVWVESPLELGEAPFRHLLAIEYYDGLVGRVEEVQS